MTTTPEQEAREAWACADRLADTLDLIALTTMSTFLSPTHMAQTHKAWACAALAAYRAVSGTGCSDDSDGSEVGTLAARVEHHADAILRAAGSGLRHYSMAATRRAILSAALDAYEEAYRAGAAFAASYRAGEVGHA